MDSCIARCILNLSAIGMLSILGACRSPVDVRGAPVSPRKVEDAQLSQTKSQESVVATGTKSFKQDVRPTTSFERVSEYLESLRGPLELNALLSGFGAVSALDPGAPCSKAIYSAVAKLMRNQGTMVLRHGADIYYYKDQYRVFFFEKNIMELNKTPDISFVDFSRLPNPGGEIYPRWRSVAIVPNASCDSAYVRLLNYGNTTSYRKFASMSVAKITSDFLRNPDKGRVTNQIYRDGFTGQFGTAKDFSYSCDEDTCR